MIRSMTGFGRGEASNDHWFIKVEAKTVNHRYLDLFIRINSPYQSLEEPIRGHLPSVLARGRVEIQVYVEPRGQAQRDVVLDVGMVKGYLAAIAELNRLRGSQEQPSLQDLLLLPDLWAVREVGAEDTLLEASLLQALKQAFAGVMDMRRREGRQLASDLALRMERTSELITNMAEQEPRVTANYQHRLKDRIADLDLDLKVTEDRLALELAVYADRCSIDEELVRLRSHVTQFQPLLSTEEPVGRKLDFLLQEMNREANTIGSKANDSELSRMVVELKAELEKIREQVQNIE